MIKAHPLKSSFMFTSIVGFLVSALFIMDYSLNWGFAFATIFVLMFIASVVSMSRAELGDEEHYKELAIHEPHYEEKISGYLRKRRKK